ncbi:hypothetical protein C7451_10274 [Blastomonas natatoria]|uniref:Uncharacterized protein n=1 Tax=Blastomonas natatoria TaxID=34015 RepID=A0A2V3VB66_9SPHN|nr:DUF6702 family protein [Blastomonas natatoria]PXW78404.1 hypothetical protein C7451_10274 [Blastomonas natatoria]
MTMAGAVVGLVLAPQANAHRGHDAMSVVTLAPDGKVTVSHRFEAHDLEPALAEIAPNAQTSLDDPDAIAELETYLLAHFHLRADGVEVPLSVSSVEIGVRDVRVDYAGTIKQRPKAVAVQSTILRDIYPRQVNQVAVRRGQFVQTLRFSGDEVKTVALP